MVFMLKPSMLPYHLEDFSKDVPYPDNVFFIQDVNALFTELKDLCSIPEEISFKFLDQIVADVLTYSYDETSMHKSW